jgi:hypothetical protein
MQRLGASGWHDVVVPAPGPIPLGEGLPSTSRRSYAKEGTAAHALLEANA